MSMNCEVKLLTDADALLICSWIAIHRSCACANITMWGGGNCVQTVNVDRATYRKTCLFALWLHGLTLHFMSVPHQVVVTAILVTVWLYLISCYVDEHMFTQHTHFALSLNESISEQVNGGGVTLFQEMFSVVIYYS